jgi:hypothetical protein
MNYNRGHETNHHRHMKKVIAIYYLSRGWMVYPEHKNCDVMAWKCRPNGHIRMIGIEAERSTRSNIRNVTRNLALGVDTVLIVVPDEKLRDAVRRLLRNQLSMEQRKKVGVTLLKNLERQMQKTQTTA